MKFTRQQLRKLIIEQIEGVKVQRLIYNDEPFAGFRDEQQEPIRLDKGPEKPKGLWYACGTAWADFIRENGWQNRYTHMYEVDINESEMLMIKTIEDFESLEVRYGRRGNSPRQWENELSIDWPAVEADYAGIEICPYRGEKRMKSFWYYSWDVASGCIWSAKAFAGIKELPLDFYDEGQPYEHDLTGW